MRPLFLALGVALLATPALADPCKAISDDGRLPAWLRPTDAFSGTVRYVGDGDSLCVGDTADRLRWVEVRLEDFDAPELRTPAGRPAKAALEAIALGQRVSCRGSHRSHDRLVATCRLRGVSLGDLMRARGVREGGN